MSYEINPDSDSEKSLATAVLYCAVNDYLKGKTLLDQHEGWDAFWRHWNAQTQKQKARYGHKTKTLGFYKSAKDFLWPPKQYQVLTDFWCHLAEIPLNNIQMGLK